MSLTSPELFSYNRYLAVAARAVRRSLQDGPRLAAERRGNMDLRFAKWEVRILLQYTWCDFQETLTNRLGKQNGKQGEVKNLAEANDQAIAAQAEKK
jgi:F-type H+-transporting ATPase subunit epsilon